MKQPADEIHVTITEQDRQIARPFRDMSDCLLATAVKRVTGSDEVIAGVETCSVGYDHYMVRGGAGASQLKAKFFRIFRPYYRKSVVGSKFTLTLCRFRLSESCAGDSVYFR